MVTFLADVYGHMSHAQAEMVQLAPTSVPGLLGPMHTIPLLPSDNGLNAISCCHSYLPHDNMGGRGGVEGAAVSPLSPSLWLPPPCDPIQPVLEPTTSIGTHH